MKFKILCVFSLTMIIPQMAPSNVWLLISFVCFLILLNLSFWLIDVKKKSTFKT